MSKLGEIYDFERQRALLSMVLLVQGLRQLVSGPEACLWAIYGQGCCPIIHKNVWPKCARTSQQELLLHVFLLRNACECMSVRVYVCTHKSEKVSVAYVYPTKRPSEASCFFFPDATVACVSCVREKMGWGGGTIRYWEVDSFFWHHVQTAKRPGLRNYWCGTWNTRTWKRYSISGDCCACVLRRVSQCRVCKGISNFSE